MTGCGQLWPNQLWPKPSLARPSLAKTNFGQAKFGQNELEKLWPNWSVHLPMLGHIQVFWPILGLPELGSSLGPCCRIFAIVGHGPCSAQTRTARTAPGPPHRDRRESFGKTALARPLWANKFVTLANPFGPMWCLRVPLRRAYLKMSVFHPKMNFGHFWAKPRLARFCFLRSGEEEGCESRGCRGRVGAVRGRSGWDGGNDRLWSIRSSPIWRVIGGAPKGVGPERYRAQRVVAPGFHTTARKPKCANVRQSWFGDRTRTPNVHI